VYTDKQHAQLWWDQHTVRPRLIQQQHERACWRCIQFLINVLGGRPLCYPIPLTAQSVATVLRGQGRRLNRQPSCICLLLPFIRISRVTSARYRRRSLSHDIVGMCGWRSISRYRLIDIIPTFYYYYYYLGQRKAVVFTSVCLSLH